MDKFSIAPEAAALVEVVRGLWKTVLLCGAVGLVWGLIVYPRIRIPGR